MKDRSVKIGKSLMGTRTPERIAIHVHLSEQRETASAVGSRYGRPIVLKIASERMNKEGHLFFRSANGVWLTEHVPVDYIEFPGEDT
jgi:RNA:NAD 2'-phosphotransferase (TPT1/KptA family)